MDDVGGRGRCADRAGPDKPEYLPGETAKVLVKSPIAGQALVTVERRSVMKSFVTEIKSNAQAIEVPIDASMAPNAFVSVFITRGAEASPRKFKTPDYKVGFCQLKVADTQHAPRHRGQSPASRNIVRAIRAPPPRGSPMGPASRSPAPRLRSGPPTRACSRWSASRCLTRGARFHQPQALAVQTGTSLQSLLPEDPEELEFTNKGYVIGGGGIEAMAEDFARISGRWHSGTAR